MQGIQMNNQHDIGLWENSVQQICGNFETRPHRDIPFVGNIRLANHSGLEVAHIETNAERVERGRKAAQDDRYCFLIMQTGGVMGFASDRGQTLSLKPGEMALIDSSRPFDMLPQGLVQQISVHLPRTLVSGHCHGRELFGKLSGQNISSQMLRHMLQQLCLSHTPDGAQTDTLQGQALQQALAVLLQAALQDPHNAVDSLIPLRQQAEQQIQSRLSDYRLTPEFLADAMQVSRRTLYRAFQEDQESIAQRILRLRLERCAMELGCSDSTSLSVTEIAFKWGFSDISQFSRAFKRHNGVSPREFRHRCHNRE
jgi:AraC family transcriptional regulator, positive regulator of tynA and feaB